MTTTPPTTQRALELVALKQPLQLSTTRTIPNPSPTQVLIKVLVAGLNPHDAKARSLGLFVVPPWSPRPAFPAVIGNDVVGRIVRVGDKVTRSLKVGDMVVAHADLRHLDIALETSSQHGLQEYAVADPEFLAKVPAGLVEGVDAVATVPTNAIAALFGLFASLPGESGVGGLGIPAPWMRDVSVEWEQKISNFDYKATTVLIVGGGSNCGRWAVQLLKLAGIGKIVVVGGSEQELKGLGATAVIDRHGDVEDVLGRVTQAADEDLVYAFDCVNPPSGQVLAARALSTKARGRLARLVRSPHLDLAGLTSNEAGFDVVNVLGSSQFNPDIAAPFWERLETWMADGSLHATPYERVSIREDWSDAAEKVNELLDRYDRGDRVVKTHFHFEE